MFSEHLFNYALQMREQPKLFDGGALYVIGSIIHATFAATLLT
jgi:hypothetical protein